MSFVEQDARISVELIDTHLEERFRPVLSEAAVVKVMASMSRRGQKQRIGVCHQGQRYRLVWGAHRLEAGRRLGWDEIDVRVVDHARASRELDEIEENLVRQNLSPLDHAAHTVRALELLAEEVGVKVGANARAVSAAAKHAKRAVAQAEGVSKADITDASAKIALAYNLTDRLAERAGISRRTVQLAVELHRGFSDEEKAQLRETDFAQNASQLRRLAALPRSDRAPMIAAIAGGEAKTWNDAATALPRAPSPPASKGDKVARAFALLPSAEKTQALYQMLQTGLPAGWTLTPPAKGGAS